MKNKGTITVFMVLITTAILTLGGVLIDLSRILLTYYSVQGIAESATRSLAANCYGDLVSDYGLYAIEDTEENKAEFLKYVKYNLNASDTNKSADKTFSLLKLTSSSLVEDDVKVEFSMPISDQTVFQKQVEDYHSKRAALIAADEVVTKFIDILTSDFIDGVFDKADKAKGAIDDSKKAQQTANEAIRKCNLVTTKPKLLGKVTCKKVWSSAKKTAKKQLENSAISTVFSFASESLVKKTSFADVSGFTDAINAAETEINNLSDALSQTKTDIANVNVTIAETSTDLYKGDAKEVMDSGTNFDTVGERIDSIKKNLEAAKKTIADAEKSFKEYANEEHRVKIIYCAFEAYLSELISQSEFESILTKGQSELKKESVKEKVSEFVNAYYSEEYSSGDLKDLLEESYNECYKQMNVQITAVQNINIESVMEIEEPKPTEKAEEEKTESVEEIVNSVGPLKNALDKITKDITPYEIYGYRPNNPVIGNLLNYFLEELDPLKTLRETIGIAIDVKNEGLGYQFILTSYIMDKTNYITSSTRRDHFFDFAETEYILKNYTMEPFNAISSLVSVFKLRLAVDTIYFFACDSPPAAEGITLLVKLGYAGVRGLCQAALDMYDLFIEGNSIGIIPQAGKGKIIGEIVPVTYRDHLNLAVLFQAAKQERLINTINATIKEKAEKSEKDTDLRKLYTRIDTTVVVDCDLIFMNVFGFRQILGNVHDGSYRMKHKTHFCY